MRVAGPLVGRRACCVDRAQWAPAGRWRAEGTAGERAQRTQEFVDKLQKATALPVATVDESHTTDEAHERLKMGGMKAKKRKEFADSVAALVILERYRHQLARG